ncbi:MAG: HypC/HybG/HupF family hydrogenase formation chaperone [Candidatus Brocadiales bacterium]
MCLGVPGKIVKIEDNALGMRMGLVDFGGTKREACLAYLDDVKVGDWVLVHIGFAISKIDEEGAADAFNTLKEMGL